MQSLVFVRYLVHREKVQSLVQVKVFVFGMYLLLRGIWFTEMVVELSPQVKVSWSGRPTACQPNSTSALSKTLLSNYQQHCELSARLCTCTVSRLLKLLFNNTYLTFIYPWMNPLWVWSHVHVRRMCLLSLHICALQFMVHPDKKTIT